MSTSRQRVLSTRVSEDVYTSLYKRAEAEGVTVCFLVAHLLGAAVGEERKPKLERGPKLPYGTMPGEELVSRSQYEREKWQARVEHWQRDVEARQAQLEQSLAGLNRRLADVLDRLQAR